MNLTAPVTTIMATEIPTVVPKDSIAKIKKIFDNTHIFHIPVVKYKKVVGMINKGDFTVFCNRLNQQSPHSLTPCKQFNAYTVAEVMSEVIATLEADEQITTAICMLRDNDFMALPVTHKAQFMGLITTHEIMEALAKNNGNEYRTIF